jgi:SAM-dependent methyltransferase
MSTHHWQKLKVLHIAPEPAIARWLTEQGPKEYVKGDSFSQGYQYAADTVHLDIQALNWESEYFDLIICSHVLEHVADDKKAIQELNRVCRINGRLLVMVPMALDNEVTIEGDGTEHPEFRKQHFGQFDHLRLYGRDFINRLSERNWRVFKWQFPKGILKHRLNKLEYLFVGIKEKI